jgi:acyl-coenzyme A synthetase/AMP-(fatty) acid ligase
MTLWELLRRENGRPVGTLGDAGQTIALAALEGASCLNGSLEAFRDRHIVVAARHQLTAAAALIELDGIARRMVVCPPGVAPEHMPSVIGTAQCDAWVGDGGSGPAPADCRLSLQIEASPVPQACPVTRHRFHDTEWVLLTSGTTGEPKLVRHTLASLVNFIDGDPLRTTWSTFYDIRRYGGLQILLRALRGGSMVLSSPDESTESFLSRAAAQGVTHISGTPSHWRKMLMSGAAGRFAPAYVRLSGEIADQGILDGLRGAFPAARVAHAFASTEAGVGFEVEDGQAGFPAALIGERRHGVEMDVSRGTLRIRSPGNALGYLGDVPPLKDPDGFVNTGDRLELREGRYYFMGRSGGIINVGGLKVHPEEVEAVINSHPAVRMSLVKARRNPITGAVVTADVVLKSAAASGNDPDWEQRTRQEILAVCRAGLAAHKVPALIHFVSSLAVSASGKLVRPNA